MCCHTMIPEAGKKDTGKVSTPFSPSSFLPHKEMDNFILPKKTGRLKSFPLTVSFCPGWGEAGTHEFTVEADMLRKENTVNEAEN